MHETKIAYHSPADLAGLDRSTPVLLALSGGADSRALLELLYRDSKDHGYELSVAHFEHGIRGEESLRDAEFCEKLAKRYGLPFYLGRADIPALTRESGESLEAVAREKRYEFLLDVMKKNSIRLLATAHHAQDAAESTLLHIMRGCSVQGIGGISPCRQMSDGAYLTRPILETKKEDILDFCREYGLDFVTDSTNENDAYLRNALRLQVMPSLAAICPSICDNLLRLGTAARNASDFIRGEAEKFIETECASGIPTDKFNALHIALRSQVLECTFERIAEDAVLESVHLDAIIKLAETAKPHSMISLPKGFYARIEQGNIIFTKSSHREPDNEYQIPLAEGIFTPTRGIIINIERNPKATDKKATAPSAFSLTVDSETLGKSAHLRTKRDGDTVKAGKMNKKVKKLFNEKKIPLSLRGKLPLLENEDGILWIPGVAKSDRLTHRARDNGEQWQITVTINTTEVFNEE